jgi:hypothetical protein
MVYTMILLLVLVVNVDSVPIEMHLICKELMKQRNAQHFTEQNSILSAITHKLNVSRHMVM